MYFTSKNFYLRVLNKNMRITNNNANDIRNFQGAYIVKGTAKSINRFSGELKLQSLMNRSTPDVMTYELIPITSETQPYSEVLVCTGEHIQNLLIKKQKDEIEQYRKLKKFVTDFNSWPSEKKKKWKNGLLNAVDSVVQGEIDLKTPEENALASGNLDSFLDWYSDAVKNSNQIYCNASQYGALNFPAKIRRLDADKVSDALIGGNFNLKEGFFRNPKNPEIKIEESDMSTIRTVGGRMDSIVTYHKTDEFDDSVNEIYQYAKLYYNKLGKLIKSTVQDASGRIIKRDKYDKM